MQERDESSAFVWRFCCLPTLFKEIGDEAVGSEKNISATSLSHPAVAVACRVEGPVLILCHGKFALRTMPQNRLIACVEFQDFFAAAL